jgi:hypothetical protein
VKTTAYEEFHVQADNLTPENDPRDDVPSKKEMPSMVPALHFDGIINAD